MPKLGINELGDLSYNFVSIFLLLAEVLLI